MPHLFVNRPRVHHLSRSPSDRAAHFLWERVNAALYKAGGAVFIAGSVLFFPAFSRFADAGVSLFLFGSLLYLVVTTHDFAEVLNHRRWRIAPPEDTAPDLAAAAAYLAGTVLFTVGSVLFYSRIGRIHAGAWCFVAGSLLFVAGATINVLQIVRAQSLLTLQLMNLTAVSFVVGSVLFVAASVPYLWAVRDALDRTVLHAYLAWQYLTGSALFLLGGVFNGRRALAVARREPEA